MTDAARSTRPVLPTLEASLEVVSRAVRYHDWLADQLGPHLQAPVLEIGSGLGTLAFSMARWASPILASEPDPAMETRLQARCDTHTGDIRAVPGIFLPDITYRPQPEPRTVVLSNVLEHIENDAAALESIAADLPSAERLVVVVPAHQWAYAPLDEQLGHNRRYRRRQLAEVIEKGGWHPTSVRYFNPLGVIAWATSGRLFGRDRIAAWQTDLVERIIPILRAVDWIAAGRTFGQSLIAISNR